MSAGWVAGSVRARMLAGRRLGLEEARHLAECGSLAAAVSMLDPTGYRIPPERRPPAGSDAAGAVTIAQRAIGAAMLWDLRVLAGWLPQTGTSLMRALAGWFEIANLRERLVELADRDAGPAGRPSGIARGQAEYFELGALATAWPRLRDCEDVAAMRAVLATSAWQDPGGEDAGALIAGLHARWAERIATLGDQPRIWAQAAVALILAGELAAAGRSASPKLDTVGSTLLGPEVKAASSVAELRRRLPRKVAWVLGDPATGWEPWQGEVAWWRRVEQDGLGLLASSGFDRKPVIGSVVVLAADARRVRSALGLAARGGGLKVFDALA